MTQSEIDLIYLNRNMLYIMWCLTMPHKCAWKMEDDDWAVLYLELPIGQISYHIHRDQINLFEDKIKKIDDYEWNGSDNSEHLCLMRAVARQSRPSISYAIDDARKMFKTVGFPDNEIDKILSNSFLNHDEIDEIKEK